MHESYDEGFDQRRLSMLASQFATLSLAQGSIEFTADEDDRLAAARWFLDDNGYEEASKAGLKLLMMELLDTLIQYRARCCIKPRIEGIVYIKNGNFDIVWLDAGSTSINNS